MPYAYIKYFATVYFIQIKGDKIVTKIICFTYLLYLHIILKFS